MVMIVLEEVHLDFVVIPSQHWFRSKSEELLPLPSRL